VKKFLIILILLPLYGCADPETGRDVFGNLSWGTASKPVQIGENKYYTEMWKREVGVKRAQSFCSSLGKSLEVIKIDAPEKADMMLTFSCN
jgi:hypothetical protein